MTMTTMQSKQTSRPMIFQSKVIVVAGITLVGLFTFFPVYVGKTTEQHSSTVPEVQTKLPPITVPHHPSELVKIDVSSPQKMFYLDPGFAVDHAVLSTSGASVPTKESVELKSAEGLNRRLTSNNSGQLKQGKGKHRNATTSKTPFPLPNHETSDSTSKAKSKSNRLKTKSSPPSARATHFNLAKNSKNGELQNTISEDILTKRPRPESGRDIKGSNTKSKGPLFSKHLPISKETESNFKSNAKDSTKEGTGANRGERDLKGSGKSTHEDLKYPKGTKHPYSSEQPKSSKNDYKTNSKDISTKKPHPKSKRELKGSKAESKDPKTLEHPSKSEESDSKSKPKSKHAKEEGSVPSEGGRDLKGGKGSKHPDPYQQLKGSKNISTKRPRSESKREGSKHPYSYRQLKGSEDISTKRPRPESRRKLKGSKAKESMSKSVTVHNSHKGESLDQALPEWYSG